MAEFIIHRLHVSSVRKAMRVKAAIKEDGVGCGNGNLSGSSCMPPSPQPTALEGADRPKHYFTTHSNGMAHRLSPSVLFIGHS